MIFGLKLQIRTALNEPFQGIKFAKHDGTHQGRGTKIILGIYFGPPIQKFSGQINLIFYDQIMKRGFADT